MTRAHATYALDATPMLGRRTGIGRYVEALVRGIAPLLRENEELVLCAGTARLNPLFGVSHEPLLAAAGHPRVTLRRSAVPLSLAHAVWNRSDGPPGEWLTGPVTVFHGTNFLVPPLVRGQGVVSVHDLAHLVLPGSVPADVARRFERSVRASVGRSQRVITDSASAGRNVAELLCVPPERIDVIPLGVDPAYLVPGDEAQDAEVARRHGLERPYALFVGATNPRKNLPRLVRAFGRARAGGGFPHVLAVVGDRGYGEDTLRAAAAPWLVRVDYVPEEDLPALYRASAAFVFPSLHEGFGLPLLEAMGCGVPVLTSDRGSLPEVAGDAALIVDPEDEDVLADGLLRLLTDERLRADLAERGRRRVRAFSWERCAQEHLELYRRVAANAAR